MIFAIWVAIRQRAMQTITWINPFTVGAACGLICFPLFQLTASQGESVTSSRSLFTSASIGLLAGFAQGFIAVLYVAIALTIWKAIDRRKEDC